MPLVENNNHSLKFGCQPKCINSQELMKNSPQLLSSEMENPHYIVVKSPFSLVAQQVLKVFKVQELYFCGGMQKRIRNGISSIGAFDTATFDIAWTMNTSFLSYITNHVTLKLRRQISHFPELQLVYT